jgi:DNA repair protein RadA/Sms
MGKCPDCGAWDSLDSERTDTGAKKDPQKGLVEAWAAVSDGEGGTSAEIARPLKAIVDNAAGTRISTCIGELDRVLGGEGKQRGLVPGSAILIGGSPGIGKSTLLLQAAAAMAGGGDGAKPGGGTRILYVSSEESAQQVKMRSLRLVPGAASDNLYILADTNLARIVEQTRKVLPAVLVIDSIQMVYKSDVPASPGSVTQLRRCCAELVYLAKASGIAIVMVGHVTKDGQLAGPRVLEHMVDAVLNFEGDRYHAHRLVRCVKNRFGTTQEIGIFEMTAGGCAKCPKARACRR